jgi:hypothetical protein
MKMGETDSADKLHGFGRGVLQHLFLLKQWEEKVMNYKLVNHKLYHQRNYGMSEPIEELTIGFTRKSFWRAVEFVKSVKERCLAWKLLRGTHGYKILNIHRNYWVT